MQDINFTLGPNTRSVYEFAPVENPTAQQRLLYRQYLGEELAAGNEMMIRFYLTLISASIALIITSCQTPPEASVSNAPTTLAQVPAVRLNYRYEADVPAPTEPAKGSLKSEIPRPE
jgi:hypothetical protein